MFFGIQENKKPLIKAILNCIQTTNPRCEDVISNPCIVQHGVSSVHADLVVEQLQHFDLVEIVDKRLFLTFDGGDLLHKLP
ncbi:hypothetical protein [Vibrio sp. OPT18]|uniref:hypothetical protein n=1 Tax=Vibrio sp. OPT18 TaxID=2778641 RepID=UPI00187EE3BD|nr:hypothetical protein [Vibrio sp. OPT18]MBE8578654.1 hypothetical protein [Vibrio sp. OPT18]